MLTQLQHRRRTTGELLWFAQREIEHHKDMTEWVAEVRESHPLPDGAEWLVCEEGADRFVLQNVAPVPVS